VEGKIKFEYLERGFYNREKDFQIGKIKEIVLNPGEYLLFNFEEWHKPNLYHDSEYGKIKLLKLKRGE
jgi:beta-galactosidase beta subunit